MFIFFSANDHLLLHRCGLMLHLRPFSFTLLDPALTTGIHTPSQWPSQTIPHCFVQLLLTIPHFYVCCVMVLCASKYVRPKREFHKYMGLNCCFFFSNAWKKPSKLITMRAFVSLVCGHVGKVHPSLLLGKMENMCMCVQVYFIYFLGNNNSECKIIIRRRFHRHSLSYISWLAFVICTALYFS